MTLHKVTLEDVFELATIAKQTFFDTYEPYNSHENMANYLSEHFSVKRLQEELNHPNMSYYFSKNGDEITGYVKLNLADAQTDINDNESIEMERLYILKKYQGQGIGRFMTEKIKEMALKTGKSYVWLAVWENNSKAIAFYEKLGFEPFGEHFFDFAGEQQMDILMKIQV